MFERVQFFVPSLVLDKIIREFTLSARFWTAYPADKIETILRYNHIIPGLMYYSHFDSEKECAVFSMNKSDMMRIDIPVYRVFDVVKEQKLLKS